MTTAEQIVQIIENEIRPALESHGGGIEFMGYDAINGVLKVQLTGACGSCPMATETLRIQVESVIKGALPEVKEVVRA